MIRPILLSLIGLSPLVCGWAQEGEAGSVPSGPRAGGTVSSGPSTMPSLVESWGSDYQIEVFGGTPRARIKFLSFGRELRDRFRWSVFRYRPGEKSRRSDWNIPIRIDIWGEVDDVFKRKAARTGVRIRPDSRFEIWVAARLHDRFDEAEFRLEMVRALVVEQMLTAFAGSAGEFPVEEFQAPPAWIVYGFDQLLLHRAEGRPSAAFSGVLQSGAFLAPEEIFAQKEPESLDPVSLTIFRMSSAALVEALLDQPQGDRALREFLSDLPLAQGDSVPGLLRVHFPALREVDDGIRKWWTVQVATLAEKQRFEYFGSEETERWLDECLTVRFGNEDGESKPGGFNGLLQIFRAEKPEEGDSEEVVATIHQFEDILGREGSRDKLVETYGKLQNLKLAAFPLYRDVIDRYAEVVRKLAVGQTVGVRGELAELTRLRETITTTLERTEDYLNYYEATQSPYRTSEFDEYRRTREALRRKPPPSSDDPIARFLDAVEFGSPGGAASPDPEGPSGP